MENLKIIIIDNYANNCVEVWLREQGLNDSKNINYVDNKLIETSIPFDQIPDSSVQPFLKLPMNLAGNLFNAIFEHISKNGIKTPNENLLIGKLQATEEHLKDMREFTKLLLDSSLKKE